jgi:hypothetical protein
MTMRTVVVTCDRCGVEIDQSRLLLRVEAGRLRLLRAEIDLCGPCSEKLESWLAGERRPGCDRGDC